MLRLIGLYHGGTGHTQHEQHPSQAILKDGRVLVGFAVTEKLGPTAWRPRFYPCRTQPDGSVWVRAATVANLAQLPPDMNVLHASDVDKSSTIVQAPADLGLETALAKILVGTVHYVWGRDVVGHRAFDSLRACLWGEMDPSVNYRWIPDPAEAGAPGGIAAATHAICFGTDRGSDVLSTGVSLHGNLTLVLEVPAIGLDIPGRALQLPDPPG